MHLDIHVQMTSVVFCQLLLTRIVFYYLIVPANILNPLVEKYLYGVKKRTQ